MSTNLIAHLKKKCEEDDNVKILLSQWEFDQKLVGKALENIGGFYPHFSNHNASHSQQILVNIERILGNDIELLSATDTWLILEAAYWHDVGMLIDAKNAKEVHSNPDFNSMIQTIANEKGHDLQKFCQAYVEQNWLSAIGTVDHPFDGIEQYRQLVAEWFRRGHDKRVGKIVEDPFKDLGITSPRTELLPNRIYRYLGQICVSHGMNFDTLMETIPYKQTGLGTEDCHPRFIGCLLRLGDLFDLDDNRFCPVMAKHVSNMPSVSKHHYDKHLSLREFQLDKRTVKLVAECPDEMSYVETQNWFGWIREEFQNQMSQWNLIVPSLKFGSLPTIEQLDVKMEIKYENGVKKEKLLLNNKPMKFKLDEKNAMELLQGANLYNSNLSIYRELIQNSIDATMLRIWLEEDQNLLKQLNPYHLEFRKILEKYPLQLEMNKVTDIDGSLNSIWEFKIIDQGVGISTLDLSYMQKMAGSGKNLEKQKIISQMPIWMRPSGEFGIGLHSIFLLTKDLPDEMQSVRFSTYNYLSHENLDIEMNSPLGGKQGYCFITKISGNDRNFGTTTKFFIKCSFDYEKINIDHNCLENILDRDYFEKEWSDSHQFEIYEEILKNAPIEVVGFSRNNKSVIWDSEKNVAFYLMPDIYNVDKTCEFLFRGQKVNISNYREYSLSSFYIDYMVDIYGESPKKILNISRDYWNFDFEYSHKEYLTDLYMKHLIDKKGKENDLLKLVYGDGEKFNDITSNEWKDYSIGNLKIKNILSKKVFYLMNIPLYIENREDLKKNIRKFFNGCTLIEPINEERDGIFIHGLEKYCELNSYKKYYLKQKKNENTFFDLSGVSFFSTGKGRPIEINDNFIWEESSYLFSVEEREDREENVFIDLWKTLKKQSNEQPSYHFQSIIKSFDRKRLLEKFEYLFIHYDEPWREMEILSPYQIIDGEIKLLDIDNLSAYVANKKNDLQRLEVYKNLYQKLVIEIDKYK
ncbi:HD domain-containing protein [Acinetobacter bereziniae]|uniref:HD domain-containing protein n=1 Tax=Acinetobacter bereziniae TaxID=106648 RepID=UPI0032B3D7B6